MDQGIFSGWTSQQRHVVVASFLGWTLDAFDFFLLVFVLKDLATDFRTTIPTVTFAILLTLAMRPIGAYIFGRAADRWGRKPTLMVDVLLYSAFEFATAFSPNLTVLLILRAFYGIAMGGEWGVGASLTMETIPPKARGFVSGLLQSGYPAGYFLASLVFAVLYTHIGWRGMFMVGVLPALLIFYIRQSVPESPAWRPNVGSAGSTLSVLRNHWKIGLYAIVLMTAFNFFSHGTQDLYPTFLTVQHKLPPATVGVIAMIYNAGAIIGGIVFGSLSEQFGRRRMIVIAVLLSLLVLPLWAFSTTVVMLALGAFLMQVMVQGAWGIIPVHLNELSPPEARGTFPGFVYQTGNLIASVNATLQANIAVAHGGQYSIALAIVAGVVAVVIAILTAVGVERRGVSFTNEASSASPPPANLMGGAAASAPR